MAVRVIDVASPRRDWDRVRDNRCRLQTVETVFGIPSTLCLEIKGKPSKGESSDGSCTLGGATQRPRWGDKTGLSSARLFNTNDKTN